MIVSSRPSDQMEMAESKIILILCYALTVCLSYYPIDNNNNVIKR